MADLTVSAAVDTMMQAANAAGIRTAIGTVIGTDVQAHTAALDAVTGTNTGDQTITLTGDVTGSGTGSFATAIGAGKVTSTMILDGTIVNADINASAAIAYSKLALTGAILNADLAGSIAASKLIGSDIATVGTLTAGATGAGFTVALGTSTLTGILGSVNGGTGNGFTKFSGPTTAERTKTLRDASDTILELGGSYTTTGTWTSMTLVTPALGTPASGVLTNVTGYNSNNLTGTILNSGVTASSLVSVGTLTTLTTASAGAVLFQGVTTITPAARPSTAWPSYFVLTMPGDSSMTASVEAVGVDWTTTSRNFTGGALTLQRERFFRGPTYTFTSSSTITDAVNLELSPPVAGANATITNAWALRTTGSVNIGSASANALVVGANGATNAAFGVDASASSQSTGIYVFGLATGNGVRIEAKGGGTNESLQIKAKGSGSPNLANGNGATASFGDSTASITPPSVRNATATAAFTFTGKTDTALTAGTEVFDVNWNLAQTKQHASNTTVATQRHFLIQAPTDSFASATGTITNAATFAITGPPVAGTNAVITNPKALWVQSGISDLGGGPVILPLYTVATLPSTVATGAVQGAIAVATDLLTPAFLTAAVGGGAVVGTVLYNGTAWVAN